MNQKVIKNKNIYIVDKHNEVLKAWIDLKKGNRETKYNLLTLDTHTDFREGFIRFFSDFFKANDDINYLNKKRKSKLSEINLDNINDDLIKLINNDEHIDIAKRCNIFNNIFAITWSTTTNLENKKIYNLTEKCKLQFNENIDKALEDIFLDPQLKEIEKILNQTFFKEKYVLDIDLDYFCSSLSLKPKSKKIFYKLIKNAEIITIAKEEDFLTDEVKRGNAEILNVNTVLNTILQHIEDAITKETSE